MGTMCPVDDIVSAHCISYYLFIKIYDNRIHFRRRQVLGDAKHWGIILNATYATLVYNS